jgi:hypothetical protein
MAHGREGDYLLSNDRIRAIIRAPGRDFSFVFTYGGTIIDADLVRGPGEPGRDNFGAFTPQINLSSTVNVQEITVVNDGRNGQPAVLRAIGVDDLFDAIDPTNAIRGFGFGAIPVSAQDVDIPVEIMTEYTLAPGDSFIRIETFIMNNGASTLNLYVGDFVEPNGELDPFVPGLAFGEATVRIEMPYLAFTGVGQAAGTAYAFVPTMLAPDRPTLASAFTQSGFFAYVMGQNVLDVLLGQLPGALRIPAGQMNSYTRYFVVGEGDVASIVDTRNQIFETETGTVRGTVTVDGVPVENAVVTIAQKPGQLGAELNVVDSFRTDAEGRYEGTIAPGNYVAMAKVEGHPYDSGSSRPTEHPITVPLNAEVVQDFDIPPTGGLRVTVVDQDNSPIPAKVSIVGFNGAPDPRVSQNISGFIVGGFLFGSPLKERGAVPFGLAAVLFADADGDTGAQPFVPGEYEVVVTRGPEYSAHSERIVVESGETTTVNAKLVRVVDTAGFVSTDYHVHMLNSLDSWVTQEERILTMAAEGVDYFIASDHDFLTDLRPLISELGLEELVASTVSEEITTFNYGHFNAWPLVRDPGRLTGGAIDWGRSGVAPGMDYPSRGNYDLSPAELFAAARERFVNGPGGGVVQVNHINSETLGYLHLLGIDTALNPPQSFTPPTRIRQNPSLTNLYDDAYSALEVWIEASRAQTALFLDANLGDWFNLLNQGRIKAATADSDTHTTAIIQAGGPRNFVASSADEPAELDEDELAANVNAGRLIGTNAPFVRFSIEGDDSATAGLALGQPKLVRATSGNAVIRLNIQSPLWAELDTIEVYANTVPVGVEDENFHFVTTPRYTVEPTLTRMAGTDFEIQTVVVDPETPGASRFQADVEIPLSLERDAWVVVLVKGTDGVSRPLWPMNPQDLSTEGNDTLDGLTDGNLGEGGNPALAFTNPLFVDVDGNGQFDPSFELP